jgi:hypothetical protein
MVPEPLMVSWAMVKFRGVPSLLMIRQVRSKHKRLPSGPLPILVMRQQHCPDEKPTANSVTAVGERTA